MANPIPEGPPWLFTRFGEDILGPWESQSPETQSAWIALQKGYEEERQGRGRSR